MTGLARRAGLAAALVLLGLPLGACGKVGPIVAPERRLPNPPAEMRASVAEQAITVTWTNPRTRVDNSRLRDLAVLRLFRREEAPDAPAKPPMLSGDRVVGYEEVARIPLDAPPPAGVDVQGTIVTVTDTKVLAFGHRYVYVATAEDSTGRRSAPSPRLPVMFLAGPVAPTDLRAEPGDREARLTWQAPGSFLDGAPATGEIRYVVLRGAGEGALAPITPAPIAATSFTDTGIQNETTYRYAVRGVRVDPAGMASGALSTAVEATPENTKPPSPPTRLIAIPVAGSVRLAWNPSPDQDVVLYAVYRAEGAGPFTRIATTQPVSTLYSDTAVQSGRTYRYAVTALNRARQANESARSNEASVTVP